MRVLLRILTCGSYRTTGVVPATLVEVDPKSKPGWFIFRIRSSLGAGTNSSTPFPLLETGRSSTPVANCEIGHAVAKSILHPSSGMTVKFTQWCLDHRTLLGNHS